MGGCQYRLVKYLMAKSKPMAIRMRMAIAVITWAVSLSIFTASYNRTRNRWRPGD